MTVAELIEELKKMPQDIDVVYWDADADEWTSPLVMLGHYTQFDWETYEEELRPAVLL